MPDLRALLQALTPSVPLPEGLNTATGTVGIDAPGNVLVYQPPDVIEYSGPGGPFLPLSGGQMTGLLVLSGDPVVPLGAATKEYVDAAVTAAPFLPLAGGVVTGPTVFTQVTTNNFPTLLLVHGSLYGAPQQTNTNWTQIALDVDYADAAAPGGPGTINYFYAGGTMDAGFSGHRTGINSFMYCNGTPGSRSTTQFVTALVGWSIANMPDNGQNNTIMASNLRAHLTPTASGWGGLCGLEIDMDAEAGSSVALKEGFKVVLGAIDQVSGSAVDAAMLIVQEAGGTHGWTTGFSFGSATGVWPILPNGTMIGTSPTNFTGPAYACAYGIDLSTVAFSGAAFRSAGFEVNGSGDTMVGGWLIAGLNSSGLIPLAANAAAISWNHSGGGAEVDYWNTYGSVPTDSHVFWQRSGTTTATRLCDIDPYGNVTAYAGLRVEGPNGAYWYSGTGAPTATVPPGSLYSRTDGAVGTHLYVSAGGGVWAPVAGV